MTDAAIRVLIIGAQGQIARATEMSLRQRGFDVVVAARPNIDLTNHDTIARAMMAAQPDVVVNAAAYTAVDRAEDEPEAAYSINRDGAGVVSAEAARCGAAVVHFSTDYVFDGKKGRPYVETDPVAPLGVYGRSKFAGELAVSSSNPRHVILRTAWVVSPFGTNFVRTILRLGRERHELRVVDDQRGAPTFATDIARAVAEIIPTVAGRSATSAHFGTFHLASAGETSWYGFASAIIAESAALGGPSVPVLAISTKDYPTKASRPAYSKLETSKLSATYGIEMPHWRASLRPCLEALIEPSVNLQ